MSDTTAPAASADTQDFTEYQERYIGSREHDSLDALGELVGEVEGTDGSSAERSSAETPEGKEPDATKPEPAADQQEGEAAEAEPDVEELLKSAVALDYTVNGESKTFDGISVIPGQGAIVTEAALPQLRDRLQQAESARADARQLYQRVSEYETLTFKDRGGTEHKGRPAFENMYVEHAKQNAALELLAKTVSNADTLAGLLTYDPQSGKFLLNEAAVQQLQREIGLTARETEWSARNKFGESARAATAENTVATQRSSAITGAVQHWASQFPELTPDDLAKAQQHFTRIGSAVVRPATLEEAQAAGVKPGELVIDHPLIHEFLSDRAALRKGAVSAASTATATTKENAQRLAAAQAGKKPTGKRSAAPTVPTKRDKRDLWEEQKARLHNGQWSADNE